MKKAFHISLLLLLLPVLAFANIVTYEYEPMGMTYGSGTHAPGDFIFNEDSADVYIDEFFSGGTPYFNFARIEPASAVFGTGQIINTNNVDLIIDFAAAGDVTFEYLDMGGSINLQVNGYAAVLEAGDLAGLVGAVAPGVTLNVTVIPVGGGHKGVATLTGPVQKLRVGGQEFWLDNMYCDNGIGTGSGPCDFLVNHETLSVGDTWGSATNSPGDWIFNEDGIDVTIHELDWGTGGLGFNFCRVEPAPIVGFGFNQVMNLNNVTNLFHISSLGIGVAKVTFEYLDFGGTENLQVNGATLHIGNLHTFPTAVAPGVTMNVTTFSIGGGIRAEVELIGNVQELLIGGQEFYLDEICVLEGEPPVDPCDYLVDHESLPLGQTWSSGTNSPGDWIFNEDGIDVTIDVLDWGTGLGFNFCRVETSTAPTFGSAHVMNLNNVTNRYHINSLGITVEAVKFEYLDYGGTENLQVNGATVHVGHLPTFPVNVAPGVTLSVTTYPVSGGERAEVVLTGDVQELLVGGQEFYIDEICVIEGVPLECDFLVDHESLAIGDAWGSGLGHSPGDLAFIENNIPVILDIFDSGFMTHFNQCDVVPALSGMGDARVMQLNNICNVYDVSAVGGWVAEVTFEFLSLGGVENIEVDGAGRFIGDIELAPNAIAPGIVYTVTTTPVPGGVRGTGRLVGPVSKLLLGGQEFWVDNICVKLHPASGVAPELRRGSLDLRPNFPNPFNPRTTLSYSLERDANVKLTIHDAAGRLVKTLVSEHKSEGAHQVVWDGRDNRGSAAAAGVYLVRVATDQGEVKTQKIGLIK